MPLFLVVETANPYLCGTIIYITVISNTTEVHEYKESHIGEVDGGAEEAPPIGQARADGS